MKKEFLKDVLEKPLLWLLVSVMFGLLQAWILIFRELMIRPLSVKDCFELFFWKGGVLLFFCSGISISNAFEVWIQDKIKYSISVKIVFHILFPIWILLIIIICYLCIFDGTAIESRTKLIQLYLLISSLSYSTITRIHLGLI